MHRWTSAASRRGGSALVATAPVAAAQCRTVFPPAGGGAGGGSSSSTLDAMDRMATKAAKSGSAFSEEVQAERRAAFHRKQEERRRLVEKHARPATGPAARKTFTGASSIASDNVNTSADAADSPLAEAEAPAPPSLFAKKLGAMHTDMFEKRKDANISLKQERKAKVRLDERRQMLRFREVDDELDSLILRRDMFLWLKTLRSGMSDSVTDQMLERELRYYPEESNREVRYNPKLMTGLPHLSSGHSFPTLAGLTRLSSISAMRDQAEMDSLDDTIDAADKAAGDGAGGGDSRAQTQRRHRLRSTDANAATTIVGGDPTTAKKRLVSVFTGSGKDFGGVTVNKATFPKPTLVTLSQFTFNTAVQQYDDLWVELLRPDTSPSAKAAAAAAAAAAGTAAAEGGEEGEAATAAAAKKAAMPATNAGGLTFSPSAFNVLRIKTFETPGTMWIKNIILSAFSRGLDLGVAQETLYGDRVTRLFMPSFGIRNFSTTYCFLVDQKGRVRWLSAGEPSAQEKAYFPALLRELEMETLRGQGGGR